MNIVLGLGNTGEKYARNRHNVGWMVLDEYVARSESAPFQLKKKLQAEISKNPELILLKPTTFMNNSGIALRQCMDFFSIEPDSDQGWSNLWVVHDDLDIELGKFKIQMGKGPKSHNGLLSVYQHLGTEQFWHVRVGVDGRNGDRSMAPHQYVLQDFLPAEQQLLQQVLADVRAELSSVLG